MRITHADLLSYALPLRRPLPGGAPPTAVRTGLLLRLKTADGALAYGDVAPLPGVNRETLTEARAQAETVRATLCGEWSDDPVATLRACTDRAASDLPPSVRFGLESALLNLCAACSGTPWHRALSRPCLDQVPVCALVSGTPDERIAMARAAAAEGYTCVKIKVGPQLGAASPSIDRESQQMEGEPVVSRPYSVLDDAAVVCAVQAACGGAVRLRIDANRAWSLSQARDFVRAVQGCTIDYIEEPLRDPSACVALRVNGGVRIALDETIRDGGGRDAPAADVWIIKPTRCGGIAATLALAEQAHMQHREVIISSTFESSVGLRALCQLAALTQTPGTAAGLGTAGWFGSDTLREPLRVTGGCVAVDAMAAGPVVLDGPLSAPY